MINVIIKRLFNALLARDLIFKLGIFLAFKCILSKALHLTSGLRLCSVLDLFFYSIRK